MDDDARTRQVARVVEIARRAWDAAHRGLPSNPMTRAAAIPATGAMAAALLGKTGEDGELVARAERAVVVARRAWQQSHAESSGNPIAMTAERSVIGILAAAILALPDDDVSA
jgi:hypothetical protein